ncbi:hypothetical protein EJP77_18720 [Paenibacillus zeisoli]|uniref:Uncharacterized protein n=1 Tax=Paenibacillus zeisoli TaxID=2496267 RepID=A0A433X253_9BACL|nr:hypothetical protein [Paenibacillus zeisoli]RUT28050.1 hypothetical protein EJP77_18720 [Paenibacillus zeisoli]
MNWLQGGPFFELSFIIEDIEPLYQTIIRLVNSSKIKIVLHNTPEFIEEFYHGYPFDEDKPEDRIVNQISLNLTFYLNRTRHSLLLLNELIPIYFVFRFVFMDQS